MDSKIMMKGERIKARSLVLCAILLVILTGCKQNNWLDWKVQNELWLEQNAEKPGVQQTSTGLQYKIIADPTPQDACPNTTSTIVCDYTVQLINGYEVDKGNNITLKLSQTIPGFYEGCHKIHNNGDIELYIPAYLGYDYEKYQSDNYSQAEGYGTEGTQSYIPPYSTLIYTIHICSVSGD